MSEFKVSVIVPVFNAEKYLRHSVESAVKLDEVGEILLIEDKSPDNALALCNQLAREFDKVKVFTHPNRENRGAGESRNLGIRKSSYEFVAFLDADDWYLPHRFKRCREIFAENKNCDGVYEATGYYHDDTKQLDPIKLTTIKKNTPPQELLFTLLSDTGGRFHTNAITIRKSILEKTGMFDPSLRLHQDTHLWLRLAFAGTLMPGEVKEAVAIRRVHSQNRIQHFNRQSRNLLHIKTFQWFKEQANVNKKCYRILFNRYAAASNNKVLMRIIFTAVYLVRNPGEVTKMI